MEVVILTGLQASGKSSFCRERLYATHLRINLDMLRTRHRERRLIQVCLETNLRFVVDNTNPTRADRAGYIGPARAKGFRVVGYHFAGTVADCHPRNLARTAGERVPLRGLEATAARLEVPSYDEGYDELYGVRLLPGAGFAVELWAG